MSFSTDVKEELVKHLPGARHCALAELMGIMHYAGFFGRTDDGGLVIGFKSDNPGVLRKGFTLWKKTFNIESAMVPKGEEAEMVLEKFGNLADPVSSVFLKNSCCRRAFLRGVFLGVGSVSDPDKSYHMEFLCDNEAQALAFQDVIKDFGVTAKIITRKKYFVVYIKEGSSIVELLNVMEAHVSLMNFENSRIVKEVRNSVNRQVNCETANIKKTADAASRQMEDIYLLRDTYGLNNLPLKLREVAEVRLEYPEATLQELGELLSTPVGKSGVNHRLRKLSELADKVRG